MEFVKMFILNVDNAAQNRRSSYPGRSAYQYSFKTDEGGIQQPSAVMVRAADYRRSLYFIADSILGDRERAEEAVRNCFRVVSRHPARFDSEGAFRSWLIRMLIDEALLLFAETSNS